MTLIICAKGKDGMVFAADSRGTFGDPRQVTAQNDTMKKVFKLNNNVVLLVAGASEIGSTIIDDLLKRIDDKMGINDIVMISRKVLKEKYDEWFKNFAIIAHPNFPTPPRPSLGMIIGGYDNRENLKTPKIFSLISEFDFALLLHDYGFALQGVPQYALYLMNRLYDENMNVNHLKHLLAYVITETATQDGKVGGSVRMAVINKTGCIELNSSEIEIIIKQNIENSARLRKLFYGEEND